MTKPGNRFEVERFLRQQGYRPSRNTGRHVIWRRPGSLPVQLSHGKTVSQGLMGQIKKSVGFLPNKWK